MMESFPQTRLRRPRMHAWSRQMVQENVLTRASLIAPIFVREGDGEPHPIKTMRGIYRHSIKSLVMEAQKIADLGIPAIAIFPYIDPEDKDQDGTEATNPDNLICRAINAVSTAVPHLGIIADVALDPFTLNGHDGLIRNGEIANDETISVLVKQAFIQAQAGATIIAPSDMMDGRIKAIRSALDKADYQNTLIMSYAAKYASAFYGPFRDAVGAGKCSSVIGKNTYQMDPANGREAMREIALDIEEGADFVMVKPGMAYLDIVARATEQFYVPLFAYQVSGEFSMLDAADNYGINRIDVIMESLLAFRRAGASGILTYFAPEIAPLLPQ